MRCARIVRGSRSVRLGLMFSALCCGGKAEDDDRPAPPSFSAPRATPTSPVASVPLRPQPEPRPQPIPPDAPPGPMPQPMREYPPSIENILSANCGQCHGPALTPSQASAGINFIDDLDKLVEAGLIVPLSSATSRIIVVMRDGSMPPPEAGGFPVSEADIEVVASFIDAPLFWLDSAPPAIVDTGIDIPPVDAGADGG
jgi:hypothetical protein